MVNAMYCVMKSPTAHMPTIQDTHQLIRKVENPGTNSQPDAFRQVWDMHVSRQEIVTGHKVGLQQPQLPNEKIENSFLQAKAAEAGLEGIIHQAAKTYNLDPGLIAAVIQTQSNFDHKAVSPEGAQGLMQLMPTTAAELGITDAFDPEQNIMAASSYLKSLVDRYDGNLKLALRAYTWGMGNVDRNPNPPPASVERFVANVSAVSTNISTAQPPTATILAEISASNHAPLKFDAIELKARESGVYNIIHLAAQTHNLDPNLIASVIHAESNFDKNAVSHAGAQGLMQLMPETAAELGVTNAFDPEQNIMAASRYLKNLLNRYDGDLSLALAAYNWGMGNLDRHPDRLPAETSNYIAKVLTLIPSEMKHESTAMAPVKEVPEKRVVQHSEPAEPSHGRLQGTTRQAVQAYTHAPSLSETDLSIENPKA